MAQSEINQKWPVIVACAVGIGVGIMALPYSTMGLFIGPLENEFGWSRTSISTGPTLMLAIVALLSPISGWLVDRYSPLVIIALSLGAVAGCFVLLAQMSGAISEFYVLFSLMAISGAGASTIVFARVVCASFIEQRGLALGLVMAGNGITAIISPITIGPIVETTGWRQGYLVIATVIAISIPLILLLLRSRRVGRSTVVASATGGSLFAEALSTSSFWLMGVAFFLGTLASTGMVIHLIPHLTDSGVAIETATSAASMIGFGLIFGRILTGWLMDRFVASLVGAAMMAVSSVGLILLATGQLPFAFFGALAIGLCIGAELDIIGYLAGKFFGMRSYGQIYGALYMLCAAGTAASPMFYGYMVDSSGTYVGGLMGGAAMLAASALLLAVLPRRLSSEPEDGLNRVPIRS